MAIGAVFTVNANVDVYIDELIARSGGPNLFLSLRSAQLSFSEADIQALGSLPSSRYVVGDNVAPVNVLINGESRELVGHMAGKDYPLARPIQLLQGQFLTEWDAKIPSKNIVLSPGAVSKLGLDAPIGHSLTLNLDGRSFPATIIGIAKPLYDTNDRGFIWIPENLFQELIQSRNTRAVIIGFSAYDKLDEFERLTVEAVEPRFGKNYEIFNPRQNFETTRGEYRIFIQAGAIIGFLALLAGSVGVMNMMLIGVQLRTREIGLYRALGFPTGVVLLAFISESLMILLTGGLLGGVLGSIFGMAIAARIVTTEPFFSESAFTMAVASSFIVGFAFAYIPAKRASAMDTVEALRS